MVPAAVLFLFMLTNVTFEITELTAGSHTITVETTGRKNAAAKSAWVWVDAFEFR